MNLNETYPEFNEKLAEALESVSDLEGVSFFSEFEECGLEDGLLIDHDHADNYLLAFYLAQLIKDGDVKLKFNPDKTDYLLRLLGLKKRGE